MAFNNYLPQTMGMYNPLAPYQQQLNSMQQQYTQYQQPQQMQQMQPTFSGIKGKPVGGEDEARNTIIDMDGSVFLFPDLQNGKVYTKQMNPETFAPIFRVYKLEDATPLIPAPAPIDTSIFARQEEVEQMKGTIASLQATLNDMLAPAPQTAPKRAVKEDVK